MKYSTPSPRRHRTTWLVSQLRRLTGVVGLASLGVLTGCAPSPNLDWQQPASDVSIRASLVQTGSSENGSVPAPPTQNPSIVVDLSVIGLVGGKLRNDANGIAARFVYIPGVSAFNQLVDDILWSAIGASGVEYYPQVHGSDLDMSDRGCISGSSNWSALELLSSPETGPAGGEGTSVTCDVIDASGSFLFLVMRVVTGTSEIVTGDVAHHLIVDLDTGQMHDKGELWTDEAASELWTTAVELLREQAGGISNAELATPDASQQAIARQALSTVQLLPDGTVLAEIPPGLTSPELDGLGVGATTESLRVLITDTTAAAWGSDPYEKWITEAQLPFMGIPTVVNGIAYNCALLPCIALTYDDGPGELTPQLLDTFAEKQAVATFYVLGNMAAAYPDTVTRAAAEGHEIGSHTINHPDLTTLSIAQAKAQVLDAASAISNLTGKPVTTFRPPYGAINRSIIDAIGLPAALWSIDANDWRRPGPEALLSRSVDVASPGDIVLFHDVHPDTVAVAGDVIDGLHSRGFVLVTVNTLFDGDVPPGQVGPR